MKKQPIEQYLESLSSGASYLVARGRGPRDRDVLAGVLARRNLNLMEERTFIEPAAGEAVHVFKLPPFPSRA